MRDRMFYGQFAGRMFLAGVALTLQLARAQPL